MSDITQIPGIKELVDEVVEDATNEGGGFAVTYLHRVSDPSGNNAHYEHKQELHADLGEVGRAIRKLADGGARCISVMPLPYSSFDWRRDGK